MSIPADEPCPTCGDGDAVPAELPDGYWRCEGCDAEWHDNTDEPE